ncbi:hypothetical protein IX84_13505 [Phaeodactylibacter xiamenensis]|uniref:Uncharacterized protein n=1 Tax=Phaeodactylibacter xiamenensis TaxID=1524460 RepID=A0A098S5C6_9BACT|nr:hypothetical protein IX84_13505 [Phaeodactylibacter xiamenensis]
MDWVHAEPAKCHAKFAEVGGVANCVAGGSRRARKGGHAKFAKCHAKIAKFACAVFRSVVFAYPSSAPFA